MMGDANGKYLSRLVAVLFVGLAFAGCAAMFAGGEQSLFADPPAIVGR